MKGLKHKITSRTLAAVLALLMVVELLMTPWQQAFAASENHLNVYTVKVTDENGAVADAAVTWRVCSDKEDMENNVLNTGTQRTGDDGILEVVAVSTALETHQEVYFEVTEISCDGHDSYFGNGRFVRTVTAENRDSEDGYIINITENRIEMGGTVSDMAGDPLEGVAVTAQSGENTLTDENGKYTLALVEGKEYTLTFTKDSYDSESVKVTVAADMEACSVQMKKTLIEDTGFQFEKEAPAAIVYGDNGNSFSNSASSTNNENANVTYSLIYWENALGESWNEGDPEENANLINDRRVADINAQSGDVTILRAGTITVKAVRSADEIYKEESRQYTLVINKADQTDFGFENPSPEDQYKLVGTFTNPAINGVSTGALTYEIIEGNEFAEIDSTKGTLTFKGIGTIKVRASKTGDDCYNDAQAEYTVTTLRKAQSGFHFTTTAPSDVVYGADLSYTNVASGGEGNGAITYKVTDGTDVATVNSVTGELQFLKAGTVKVKATKAEDGDYEAVSDEYTITVLKGTQTGFQFEKAEPLAVVWNENDNKFMNTASGGEGTGSITYTIVEEKNLENEVQDIAEIDTATGELTFKSTGVVTVKAVKAEDLCYNATEDTYIVTVNKADQTISFANNDIQLFYGEEEYLQKAQETVLVDKADGKGYGEGNITYSIEGENPLDAEIDAQTGKLTFQDGKTGSIKIKAVKAEDICYNECETSYTLTISYPQTPAVPYLLSGEKTTAENEWYIGDVTIKAPTGYQISASNAIRNNTWQDSLVCSKEGLTTGFIVYLRNAQGGITDRITVSDIRIDKSNPEQLTVDYNANFITKFLDKYIFHRTYAEVTISAEDSVSGIAKFYYRYDSTTTSLSSQGKEQTEIAVDLSDAKFEQDSENPNRISYTFTIPAQFRGKVSFIAEDTTGRTKEYFDENTVIVDDRNPEVMITYSTVNGSSLKNKVVKDSLNAITRETVTEADENTRFIYDGDVEAEISITEANFFPENVKVQVMRDGTVVTDGYEVTEWTVDEKNDKASCKYTFKEDGDYELHVTYSDYSKKDMNYSSNEYKQKKGSLDYTSNIFTIDTVQPEIVSAEYDNNVVNNGKYYNENRTVTFKVKDRNFRPSEVAFKAETSNVQNSKLANEYSELNEWTDWKQDENDPYIWIATVPYTLDASYHIELAYTDLAGHELKDNFEDDFVIDKKAPETDKMSITYSKEKNFWQKIKSYFSYKENVEVTLMSEDDISGIDYLTWTYAQENGTSTTKNVAERTETIARDKISFSDQGKTATATFTLAATEKEQFRGSISFLATDMAGNTSTPAKDDSNRINIVDNISPERTVTYSPAKQVVDANTLLTKDTYQYDAEGTNSILYYDNDVTVTFKITEANFYAEDVDIKVNGEQKNPTDWKQNGDEWTGTLTLSAAGDYQITMDYIDRSTNEMKSYRSEKIVIDRDVPTISVDYVNKNVKSTVDGRKYYDNAQTAVITIKEHNFRADDVDVRVTAVDVTGASVAVSDFAAYLRNRSHWEKSGDTYTARITYDTDANYTFDIAYKDLALREAAAYPQDKFTVDKTAPTNLQITYSDDVMGMVNGLNALRYYNQQVTVTISANDATTDIEHFMYSYKKSAGVSALNAELIDEAIQKANIVKNGNRFTASFLIPKAALQNENQFDGTVDFTAYDQSGNKTSLSDTQRIVVDNIAPNAAVTYNDPVQTVDGISYYAGDINATVVIGEANFFAEDVQIAVTRDGAEAFAPNVTWTDDSVDTHTGTFTLSENGDYVVTINYTDRSTNRMETYTSEQLTIDKDHPTIHVSDIKANSANKDETYGFTITFDDNADNMDESLFQANLSVITCDENGNYMNKEIPLSQVQTLEANKTFAISVDNLEEDGIYTLSCRAEDRAGNEYNMFMLDDGNEYESVQFSINRNGSTFRIDDNTKWLVDQYYAYNVMNDVVIEEINTDTVEDYTLKLNGKKLTEGTEFTTSNTQNQGEWSVRTYKINKDVFDAEGEYSIVVESIDKTETTSYSDVKNLHISYVVDQTAPVVTISGLENDGRYKTDVQQVVAIPTDDGGKLKSFKAVAAGKKVTDLTDSANVQVLVELSGNELTDYLKENSGQITFEVPEGLEEQVQIICTDYAVHEDKETTNEYNEVFRNVTVSPKEMVIFYANKHLFYGTIAVVAVIIAGGVTFIVCSRKKKQ